MVDRRAKVRTPVERRRPRVVARIETAHLRQLPGFIIIGAQKSGTTSLLQYLRQHPNIGATHKKEVHFFSWWYEKGMDWYRAHFPLEGEAPVVGEASPSYLLHPGVPARVHAVLPDVKLIVMLRNPVDRAYSHHQMNARKGVDYLSFEEAIAKEPERLRLNMGSDKDWRDSSFISYLSRGLYADQLEGWFDVFPRENIQVLKSEAFFADPERGLHETLDFLELPPLRLESYDVFNPGTYDDMTPETRERLRRYFAPHNQHLYELLGRDLGWENE
jgi:hypothetical protein